MQKSTKIILALLFFVFIVGGAIGILSYILINKSLPQYEGEVNFPALNTPAEVLWDQFAVPHIKAQDDLDLFRVLGYVHAQERLWQMDFFRRAGEGQLSEIFGTNALATDKLMRTWGLKNIARMTVDSLSEESRKVLTAYCEGVNHFIESNTARLPIEFSLLGYKPRSWEPIDTITIQKVVAMRLSQAWHVELTFYRIAQKFGLQAALELFPDYPHSTGNFGLDSGEKTQIVASTQTAIAEAARFADWIDQSAVSNSWVVSGTKSPSGKPILANDPHLELSAPCFWFEAHLSSPSYDVAGMSIPGIPGIVIGHNNAIAWGFTNGMIDDVDFYFEKINPQDKDSYWRANGYQKFVFSAEKIDVKGEIDPVFLDVRTSDIGPVVSDIHPLTEADSIAISMRWTGAAFSDDLLAILQLNRAQNRTNFSTALQHFGAPCQNASYADTSGTIGFHMAGLIPIRRDKKSDLLYNAWENRGDWLRYIPWDRMPQQWNPGEQFVVNANHNVAGAHYPWYLTNAWEPDSRARRITQLLQSMDKFNVDDFQKIQMDEKSLHAADLIEEFKKHIHANDLKEENQQIWQLLMEWHGEMNAVSAGATIFENLVIQLLQEALQDQLEPVLYQEFMRRTNIPVRALESLITKPNAIWWDDSTTEEKEKLPEILLRAFERMCDKLRQQGDGPGFWEWGQMHRVTMRHPIGQLPPFDYIFDRGEYNIGGSASTISKAEYRFTKPFAVDVGASMRQIVDLAQPNVAHTIVPGGQSGQPFSDHYDDQIAMWRQGKYKSVSLLQDSLSVEGFRVQRFR